MYSNHNIDAVICNIVYITLNITTDDNYDIYPSFKKNKTRLENIE